MTAKCGKYTPDEDPCDGEGWGTTGSPEFYAGLTGDPRRLYDVIEDRATDSTNLAIFVQAELLLQPNVPNDFKATLFEAMANIPGLRITDNARTTDGREGIALRIERNGEVREHIVDHRTGDLLQGRIKDTHTEAVSTVTYGVAEEPGQRPN
jgi:hypothetical protein